MDSDTTDSDCNSSLITPPSSQQSPRASELESESKIMADNDRDTNHSTVGKGDEDTRSSGVWKEIVDDFDSSRGGDRKILRAIGRTATVNAVVAATAALGPIAAVAGYATGGAITAKRLVGDGIAKDDSREVAKSLAVFGSATSASLAGQAITGALAIGALGASLPLAGALAFGVGCVSGITAGALSEWGVDGVMKKVDGCDGEGPSTKDTEAAEKNKNLGNETTSSTTNFVHACGAWVDRQRERNRQRRIEREKAQYAKQMTERKFQKANVPRETPMASEALDKNDSPRLT